MVIRVTITLPDEWLEKLEKIKAKRGYVTLSECIRALLREAIEKEQV